MSDIRAKQWQDIFVESAIFAAISADIDALE
jgi:hypothetical protein